MPKLLKSLIWSSLFVVTLWTGQAAQAAITGSFSMAGGWIPVGGTGSLSTATGLDFIPNPGVATGAFTVTSPGGTGNFGSLTGGTIGTVKDFVFTGFSSAVTDFITVGGFHLTLQNVAVMQQDNHFLLLDGVVSVTGPGITTPTQAIFLLSSQGAGSPATFSWSASTGFEGGGSTETPPPNNNPPPTNVPEPMSLALLGLGLIGYGAIRRRAA